MTKLDAPERKLARDGTGDDGLPAWSTERAFDAVQGKGRHAHAPHQYCCLVVRDRNRRPNSLLDVLYRVVQLLVELPKSTKSNIMQQHDLVRIAYRSSASGGATISSTPGMRILPSGVTSLPMR